MAAKLDLIRKLLAVTGHVAVEYVQRPTATDRADVPRSGFAISNEWLTAVLCNAYPDARVISHANNAASSGTSTRTTLSVKYNEAGVAADLPTDIFTKTSATLAQRVIIGGSGALAGETHFFMELLPQTDIEAPAGYWGAYDEPSWRSVILMEDVAKTKGAHFIEPTTPLSQSQVQQIVELMATYHGTFWNSPDIAALKTPRQFLNNLNAFTNIRARSAVGQERAKDVIPSELHGQSDRLWEGAVRSLDLATDAFAPTLLHGDSHVGQTYITSDGRMGLADWQTCQRGGWAYDFAYFVASACEPQDRRAWEHDLLHTYLRCLTAAGGMAPSFDDAWLSYRQLLFYPMAAWTLTIGRAIYQPRMQPDDTCRSIIHRLSTAIADLKSFDAIGV